DVNPGWAVFLAVAGMAGGDRAGAVENLREYAGTGRGGMDDDEDGGGEIVRESSEQVGEGLHASGAGADDKDACLLARGRKLLLAAGTMQSSSSPASGEDAKDG